MHFSTTRLARSVLATAALAVVSPAMAADHLEAPAVMGRGQLDVNDLYAFQAPNPNNTVLILTVNPFAGQLSPTDFGTAADGIGYEFTVDNNGDAIADVTYSAAFSGTGPNQTFSFSRNGSSLISGATVGSISDFSTGSGMGSITAGVFDDPFFFDLNGFENGLNFTGDDFFAGADVGAIVVELPSADFGASQVGLLGRTTLNGDQFDRIGRPAIGTALIPDGSKDAFNLAAPVNDLANFGEAVTASIASLSNPDNADALTPVLLPDLLTYDSTSATGFLNGRRLQDDVIDATLALVSDGAVTSDGVDGNDAAFRSVFPYLAPANSVIAVPEPATLSLGLVGGGMVAGLSRRRRRRLSAADAV